MEETAEGGKKVRRIFSAEQKFEILKDIERCKTIKEGLAKHQLADSVYYKWKRQLEVGVRACLRNSRPLKSADLKRLETENRKLKEALLNQALLISELKNELGLKESGRLMEPQKQAVLEVIGSHREQGRTVGEALKSLGVARSSYYRWKKTHTSEKPARRQSCYEITVEERRWIDEVKEQYPQYRHRRLQGMLQQRGIYLSASVIYGYLKAQGQVDPYARRSAPWKSPRYEVWQRNLMWGSDWSKLRVGGVRWYLLTVIDFFSRVIVAWDIVPTVHAGTIKAIYQAGLKSQGILMHSELKPELRVDRGSPNTSGITQQFFEALGAELSFARVRRPTDNALTERFYGTIKQEEIYLVGNYPDEISAREEIGLYMENYHQRRPHQSLLNFTPAHVHEVNNKSRLLVELKEMKRQTREKRKAYWRQQQNPGSTPSAGGCPSQGSSEIVDPGANTEGNFPHQLPDSQIESPTTENYSLVDSILSH